MLKNRLEAFSDAVIAIALTILVLEIKVPEWETFSVLAWMSHQFISYIFSFIFIIIYWNTHHHLLHSVGKINGKALWANNLFLFFITLVSFSTGWMAETEFARDTVILYGINIILCGLSYNILSKTLASIDENSQLRKAIWIDMKGKISTFILIIGTFLSYIHPYISLGVFFMIILLWIIPDRRLE